MAAYAEHDMGALVNAMHLHSSSTFEAAIRATRPGVNDTVTIGYENVTINIKDLNGRSRTISKIHVKQWPVLHLEEAASSNFCVGTTVTPTQSFRDRPCHVQFTGIGGSWHDATITADEKTDTATVNVKGWGTAQVPLSTLVSSTIITDDRQLLHDVQRRTEASRGRVLPGFLNWGLFTGTQLTHIEQCIHIYLYHYDVILILILPRMQ